MKYIGLLDCNNFFVSCERLFRPDLRQKPVVVLSGNDGCVVARSNEVKDLGVPMGVPLFQVRDTFTEAGVVTFSSNFTLYRDISSRVMTMLREMVDEVEPYSIDEAFFTLVATSEADAVAQLQQIKQQIEQHIGVPVSLGAAASKTIAKYASEKEKRGSGVCVLSGDAWWAETAAIPLTQVWGIGARLSERFRSHELHSVADLVAADRSRIAQLFGVGGARLYDELAEQPVWPVGSRSTEAQKSIMSTRSFKTSTRTRSVVADAVAYHVQHAAAELRTLGLECRYLQVMARASRHGDWAFRNGSAECVLAAPTNDTRVLLAQAEQLLAGMYDREVPYKKAGVVLGWFSEAAQQQPDLFGEYEAQAAARPIMEVLDSLNRTFGDETVTIGRLPGAGAWAPAREHLSPRYSTNWAELATVKA